MLKFITKGSILKFCFLSAVILSLFCSEFDKSITPENEMSSSQRSYNEFISQQAVCGTPFESKLIAGQIDTMGVVSIFNTPDGYLHIMAFLNDNWYAIESQLHITKDSTTFPMTPSGNPKIGNFAYQQNYDPAVQVIHYTFALEDLNCEIDDLIYFAFHITVIKTQDGHLIQTETAWPVGIEFPGNSWAMYSRFTIQSCDDPDDSTETAEFRTQTQGGWGTVAHGNNPGTYRNSNFAEAFPNGLIIGLVSGNHALFSTTKSIENFLPQGKTPSFLMESYTDPLSTSAGVLGGQVTALSLSVGFDLFDPDFGESETNLRDLKVADTESTFYGMTVAQILEIANAFLSSGTGTYSATQINEVVSKINENYVDGKKDNGFLEL